jgi:xanthine dehydrogenase accessory factor
MGKVIDRGEAEENTELPGTIEGYGPERVLRGPCDGIIKKIKEIGELVKTGDPVASVEDQPVKATIPGVLRGLIRTNSRVHKGMKIGDIDPRGRKEYCYTVSDKPLAIGGGVLEAILARFNR